MAVVDDTTVLRDYDYCGVHYDAEGNLEKTYHVNGVSIINVGGKLFEYFGSVVQSMTMPDGRTVSLLLDGSRHHWIINHVKAKSYDKLVAEKFWFSKKGVAYGYIAEANGGYIVNINGVESTVYRAIHDIGVVFSSNGEHHAYAYKEDESYTIVLDGNIVVRLQSIDDIRITDAGEIIILGVDEKGNKYFSHDDYNYNNYAATAKVIFMDSTGKSVSILARAKNEKWVLLNNGESLSLHDSIMYNKSKVFYVCNIRSGNVVYVVLDNNKFGVVSNEQVEKWYIGVDDLIISEDEQHYAYYGANIDGDLDIVYDGRIIAKCSKIIPQSIRIVDGFVRYMVPNGAEISVFEVKV